MLSLTERGHVGPAEVSTAGARSQRHSHALDNPEPVHIDIVCQAAGLTTTAYSFGYVAAWSGGDAGTVKATAERVITTARTVLHATGLLRPEPLARAEQVAA